MERPSPSARSGRIARRYAAIAALAALALPWLVRAVDYPSWWYARGVIRNDPATSLPATPDDYAALNKAS